MSERERERVFWKRGKDEYTHANKVLLKCSLERDDGRILIKNYDFYIMVKYTFLRNKSSIHVNYLRT